MNALQKVVEDARRLSRVEKEDLVDILRADLEDEPELSDEERREIEEAWRVEIERRLQRFYSGEDKGRSMEDISHEIRMELERRHETHSI